MTPHRKPRHLKQVPPLPGPKNEHERLQAAARKKFRYGPDYPPLKPAYTKAKTIEDSDSEGAAGILAILIVLFFFVVLAGPWILANWQGLAAWAVAITIGVAIWRWT